MEDLGALEPITVKPAVAAQLLGISVTTMYKLMHVPGFPAFKANGRTLIPLDKLREWANQQADERQWNDED